MHKRTGTLVLALALALTLSAQQPVPPQANPQDQQKPPVLQTQQEEFRLRRTVRLVSTPLVVNDATGEYVYDLTRDEIQVFDNGVPQQITSFEPASVNISLAVLINTSTRINPLLANVRKSAVLFTELIMGEYGEGAVITFDDYVTVRQNFTPDASRVIAAVKKIQTTGDETRLADAFDMAVTMLLNRPDGRRRVIIIVSQPHDRGSEADVGEVLRLAQLAGINVYTIALSALQADLRRKPEETPTQRSPYPEGVFTSPPLPGRPQTPTTERQARGGGNLLAGIIALIRATQSVTEDDPLEVYAKSTGGLSYKPKKQESLEQALSQIGQDLHNQYVVSYRPSNRAENGFHRIEVRVSRLGVTIRHRPGYYVGLPPES